MCDPDKFSWKGEEGWILVTMLKMIEKKLHYTLNILHDRFFFFFLIFPPSSSKSATARPAAVEAVAGPGSEGRSSRSGVVASSARCKTTKQDVCYRSLPRGKGPNEGLIIFSVSHCSGFRCSSSSSPVHRTDILSDVYT